MTVLTVSVHGAPPVFVLQPFLINKDAQLGTLRGGPGLVLALTGEHVLLMATETNPNQQKEEGELKHYDEGYEEIQDWKEDEGRNEEKQVGIQEYYSGDYHVGRNEEENRKIEEGKGDYESGDYLVSTNEENEDYHEKSYEESTTESKLLEDLSDYLEKEEGESQDYESNSGDGSGEQEFGKEHSTEERYVETDELTTESESREGKSTRGNGNAENNGSGNYEKFQNYPKENADQHNSVSDPESKRKTVKLINSHKDIKDVENEGNAGIGTTDNMSNKLIEALKNDKRDSVYVPEEIVIGYMKKSEVEHFKNQDATNSEGSRDESDATDASEAKKLSPHLEETEEVQLAPVVYHVSPKLLQTPTIRVTEV
jgi:hypothetical protein